MSIDQPFDQQLIEQTKRQIQSLVQEIEQLSRQNLSPGDFTVNFSGALFPRWRRRWGRLGRQRGKPVGPAISDQLPAGAVWIFHYIVSVVAFDWRRRQPCRRCVYRRSRAVIGARRNKFGLRSCCVHGILFRRWKLWRDGHGNRHLAAAGWRALHIQFHGIDEHFIFHRRESGD